MNDLKPQLPPFRHILITGASSGIGEALALYYAAPGTRLSLSGRDARRLAGAASACRNKGAEVDEKIIDVTDRAAVLRVHAAVKALTDFLKNEFAVTLQVRSARVAGDND